MSFIPRRDWICGLAIGDIYVEAATGIFLPVIIQRLFLTVNKHDNAVWTANVEAVRRAICRQFNFFTRFDNA